MTRMSFWRPSGLDELALGVPDARVACVCGRVPSPGDRWCRCVIDNLLPLDEALHPPTPGELADLFRPDDCYRLQVTDADRARMAEAVTRVERRVAEIEGVR